MKNWKTTLFAIVGATATALIPVVQGHGFELQYLVPAIAIAVLGCLSKDYDTTGTGSDARKD